MCDGMARCSHTKAITWIYSTYKDVHGDPLIRMTMDWQENERRMSEFGTAKGWNWPSHGRQTDYPIGGLGHFDANPYVVTQLRGGNDHGRV